jgi:hypothetical protein
MFERKSGGEFKKFYKSWHQERKAHYLFLEQSRHCVSKKTLKKWEFFFYFSDAVYSANELVVDLSEAWTKREQKGGKWWGKLFKRKFSRFVGRVCCVQMMTPMREKGRERAWERERKWWKMIIYKDCRHQQDSSIKWVCSSATTIKRFTAVVTDALL